MRWLVSTSELKETDAIYAVEWKLVRASLVLMWLMVKSDEQVSSVALLPCQRKAECWNELDKKTKRSDTISLRESTGSRACQQCVSMIKDDSSSLKCYE